MDGHVLFLVAVNGIWGTVLLLFGIVAAHETVEWWHRRHQRGAHHPAGLHARTVQEIQWRLQREAAPPARSLVIRRRIPDRLPIAHNPGDPARNEQPQETAMDDTDPFAVVGRIDGHRLQITAATAQAAAAAAEYWRTDYPEATVDWFLRDDLAHDQPVLLLVRWRRGVPGIGETQRVVHAIPLVPGKAVDAHASAYCDTTLQLDLMEICNPGTGVPCEQCLRLAALHLDLTD